jgi:hypothetical protein
VTTKNPQLAVNTRKVADMLKLVWFITRPETNITEAESMYQIGHVRRGMRQENLRSFRISRALQPQPESLQAITGLSVPPVFRFSEGYWESFEQIQECYQSPNGLAALADGMLNAVPRIPPTALSVLLAEEEELPSRGRIAFDIFRGRFIDPRPVKLFVFVKLSRGNAAEFDQEYRRVSRPIEVLEDVGPHVISRTRPYRLPLGKARQWPPENAEHYERVLEYYFSSVDGLSRFLTGEPFRQVMALARSVADSFLPIAAELQHVFFSTTGDQPLSTGWLNVYGEKA